MILPALILAAGRSTRIEPLAGGVPKPLLRVGGKPLIGWNLEWLAASGIRDVWINLHHRPDAVRSAVGDGARWGVRVHWSHEPELLGTAGAWRKLAPEWDRGSLVIYGDNLMRFDLRRFTEAHLSARRRNEALATIAVFDPQRHPNTGTAGGQITLDDSGRITAFEERRDGSVSSRCPPCLGGEDLGGGGPFINAGAYVMEREVVDDMGAGFQDFGQDVFPALLGSGRVFGHLLEPGAFCLGLDTPERFHSAQEMLSSGRVAP